MRESEVMLRFKDPKPGELVTVPKGESFEISLPENPGTGFRWKITSTGAPFCTMTGEEFRPAARVGGEGIHSWRFQTEEAGQSEIGMDLLRSWTEPLAPARSLTLQVVVTRQSS
jgi:inhibitor of cysteine peptidase